MRKEKSGLDVDCQGSAAVPNAGDNPKHNDQWSGDGINDHDTG